MPADERRKARRLEMRLPLVVRRRDETGELTVLSASTSNISTDGFYFETDATDLQPGQAIEMDLTLPPADGVSAFEGQANAVGEIVRVVGPGKDGAIGVGGRFQRPLKLTY